MCHTSSMFAFVMAVTDDTHGAITNGKLNGRKLENRIPLQISTSGHKELV